MEKTLSERMMYFRAEHNLTQEDLGKLCGLAGVTICNVENGSNPSKMTRIKIELALKKGEAENAVVNQQDKSVQELPQIFPTEICGESGTDTESGSTGNGQ